MRDLELALGGHTMGRILQDLSSLGINALVQATFHGLKHEDKGLSPKLVERMLSDHLKAGGNLTELYDALPKALEQTGMFRTEDSGNAQTATTNT